LRARGSKVIRPGRTSGLFWGIEGTQTVVGVVADIREGGLAEPHFDMRVMVA
jgi:hypothetical protein